MWFFPSLSSLFLFYFILLASPTGRDTATACANYCGPGTRSQFCGERKPGCPEETLEVRLRSTETQSTYNIVVEVEGVFDVHYASLTSQGVQHRVFYLVGHPSRYQPLNFGEQTGTGVFPLVIAVPSPLVVAFGDSRTLPFVKIIKHFFINYEDSHSLLP